MSLSCNRHFALGCGLLLRPVAEEQGSTGGCRSIEEPRSPTQVAEQRERGSPRQYHSWPELSEAVQTQIAVAISHNDLLQVNASSITFLHLPYLA